MQHLNKIILLLIIISLNTFGQVKLNQIEKATGTYSTVTTNTAGYLGFVPEQTLSVNGNSLSISRGNTITLPSSSTTTITAGTNVSVTGSAPNYTISTSPTLAVSGQSLSISGGNTVTIQTPTITAGSNMSVTTSGNTFTVAATGLLSSTTERMLFTGASTAIALADNTIYYFGLNNGVSPSTTQGFNRFKFPSNFTVTKVILTASQNTNYSNENISLYLRESLTTDKTITTTLDLSTVGLNACKVFVYSGLSISVSSGLDYEFKLSTPTLATNGTNSRFYVTIWGY